MWFYNYFTNGYSVNSTEVGEETHDNSDNSDVIVPFYLQWYWINFEDTKNRKQNLSSIEYIRMFGCFDIFECYDCNAVYSL